jgi:hypothetical protein
MYEFEHSVETAASAASVFRLYRDVAGWPRWDHGLAAAELDGPFAAGSTGTVTPAGQGAFPFRLVSVDEDRGFVDETVIPDTATLRFEHTLTPLPGGGTRVTHRTVVTGPAAAELGPAVTSDTPEAMESLAAHALAAERATA